ncbi:MAG: AEC family transporter [Lautropia sp.]|nr:AEC family transporter [Lautropia sp.]
MSALFDALLFAFDVTLPSVLMLSFGVMLRRTGQIDHGFATKASRLVFNYALPLLLFSKLAENDIQYSEQARLLTAGAVTTITLYLGAELYAWRFVPNPTDKGVFVQGVFRSNMAIMGLAYVSNAYGDEGLASGAVYVGVITLLYNVLSVIALSRTGASGVHAKLRHIGRNIATNPLVLSIVLALILQRMQVPIPGAIMQTARHMANIALPIALLCAGATFDIRSTRDTSGISMTASIGRILVAPIIAVLVGLAFGLSSIPMGVLFLMSAMPTAAASYVMAKSMGGNDVAAANIIAITTFGAMFSAAAGITALRGSGLM